MKRTIIFLIMIGFAAALSAQSLVNLSHIEKARRIALGGRHGPVVTNADLLRVKIRPAVEVIIPESETSEGLAEGTEPEGVAAGEVAVPESTVTAPGAGESEARPAGAEIEASQAEPTPEEKLAAAEEMIDLLETKIAALNQDYRSQTNMVPNYVIEQQLTETLKKLQNAQADAVRLRQEINRARQEKKIPTGSIG